MMRLRDSPPAPGVVVLTLEWAAVAVLVARGVAEDAAVAVALAVEISSAVWLDIE